MKYYLVIDLPEAEEYNLVYKVERIWLDKSKYMLNADVVKKGMKRLKPLPDLKDYDDIEWEGRMNKVTAELIFNEGYNECIREICDAGDR